MSARDVAVRAVLPAMEGGPFRGVEDVDLRAFWARFDAASPPSLRLTVHAAAWLCLLAPWWVLRRPALLTSLDADARDRVVVALAGSNVFAVRQMVNVLKLCACFAAFTDGGNRARFRGAS